METVDGVVALEPRELVEAIERGSTIPSGSEERFSGYEVVGLPFKSGHILCLSLVEEHHNVFFSRPDNEIFAAFLGKTGREVSREDLISGAWTRATGQGRGDLALDPKFVSGWPNVNLRLRPGSPAAGHGAY